jgi:class 3 adenylate cyclase
MPQVPLRAAMGALNAGVVLVVSVCTLTITLTVSLEALRSVGKSHASSLADGIETRVATYLEVPQTMADVYQNYTRSAVHQSPSRDLNGSYRDLTFLSRQLFMYSKMTLGGINLYMLDGTRISCIPSTGYPHVFNIQNQRILDNGTMVLDYTWYYTGNLTLVPSDNEVYRLDFTPPADIRTSGLLTVVRTATMDGRVTIFSAPLVLLLSSRDIVYYLPLVAPLRLLDGSLYGFATISLTISSINDFLRDIRGTPNTHSFAYASDGYLMATTYPEPYLMIQTVSANAPTPAGCDSGASNLLQAPAQQNATKMLACRVHITNYPYMPLRAVAGDREFAFTLTRAVDIREAKGDRYYYATTNTPMRQKSYRIQLLLIMPEADVIGSVIAGRNLAIGVSVAIFVVVAALSFAFILWLLAPLNVIARRMTLAATLQDEGDDAEDEKTLSHLAEVRALQLSYFAMNRELNRIRSFVPQSLLHSALTREHSCEETFVEIEGAAGDGPSPPASVLGASDHGSDHRHANPAPYGSARRTATGADALTIASVEWVERHGSRSPRTDGDSVVGHESRHRERRVSFVEMPAAPNALVSNLGLRAEFVTVMSLNLADFHPACRELNQDQLAIKLNKTIEFIHQTINRYKGVLDHFNGDHFIATFNAVRPCANHPRRAAIAAHELALAFRPGAASPAASMEGSGLTHRRADPDTDITSVDTPAAASSPPSLSGHTDSSAFALSARIGVASGRAYIGNLGTDHVKSFNVIGSAVTHAVTLERLAKFYRRRTVLVPQRIFPPVSAAFDIRPLDFVVLPGGKKPTIIGELVRRSLAGSSDSEAAASQQSHMRLKNAPATPTSPDATPTSGLRSHISSRLPPRRGSIHDPGAWLFAADDPSHREFATQRMNTFLALGDGNLSAAEAHYMGLLEDLSKRQSIESTGSDFSEHVASISNVTPQFATTTPNPFPYPSSYPRTAANNSPPRLSVTESVLERVETIHFLENSDIAVPIEVLEKTFGGGPPGVTPREDELYMSSGNIQRRLGAFPLRDLQHIAYNAVPRLPSLNVIMDAGRNAQLGGCLGVFYDMVFSSVGAANAARNAPNPFGPSLTARGSLSTIAAPIGYHRCLASLPPSAEEQTSIIAANEESRVFTPLS